MIMSSVEEKHFFRLIKFSYDVSLKVTRTFTKTNILHTHNNSLVDFLNAFKHEIYHLWNNTTRCCACLSNPHFQLNRELNKEQFKKLYDIKETMISGHFKKGKGDSIIQHCLCRITTKSSCSLNDLDIILIHTIIRRCTKLSPDDETWLNTIREIRNKLAHAESTTSFDQGRLEKWWFKLEGSVLGLAAKVPPLDCYVEAIEDQIKLLRNIDLNRSDVEGFLSKIKEESRQISEDVIKEIAENYFHDNIKNILEEQIDTKKQICQLEEKFDHFTNLVCRISMINDAKENANRRDTQVIEASCQVTGDNIDEELMLRNLQKLDPVDKKFDFDIKSIKRNCIIFGLNTLADIFQSEESFRQAIKSLVTKIVLAGEQETSVPCSIKINLTFKSPLSQDELKIISSLKTLHLNTDIEHHRPVEHEKKAISSPLCDPCHEKNKDINGIMWCSECNEILCSDCTSCHHLQKATQGHDLVGCNFKVKVEEELSKQQDCPVHSQLQVEYYCLAHDVVFCRACLPDNHRSCDDVIALDIACQDANKWLSVELQGELKNIDKTVKCLEDETNKNLTDIKNESKNIEYKITRAKATAIYTINEYEKNLMSEIQKETREALRHQQEMTQKSKNIVENLVINSNLIQFVEKHGTAKQAFLLAYNLKPTVENLDVSVSNLLKSASMIYLRFDETTNLTKSIPTLGSITKSVKSSRVTYSPIIENQAQCFVPGTDKPLTSFKLTSTFRTSVTVTVFGMIVTEDSRLLLCNFTDRNEVLVYNYKSEYESAITMRDNPRDIAIIPGGDHYVVTLPVISSIQYINNDLKPGRCVKLSTMYLTYGLTADQENIYVGEYNKILVLNHDGTVVREIKLGNSGYVYYLVSNDNKLYASNNRNIMYCIDRKQDRIRRIQISGEKIIRKIIVDRLGYVYVGGETSGKIHRLDRRLKQSMTIGADSLAEISAICFNKNCSKLFVANDKGKSITVFSCT